MSKIPSFQLCSFYMAICIAWTIPYLLLVTYRNIFGPLDQSSAIVLNFCKLFGSLCCLITFFEINLVWYVIKMVLKFIPRMADKEWAKVLGLFNILSMSSVAYIMLARGRKVQDYIIRHTGGYPTWKLDPTEEYLTIR